ncbi:MAG: glycosyltransferase family 4 protein [Sphaerochaetaceae bacterium]|nr:glycosyltransferase family 4 protein [Sphaerochaetaceae bacterium]
MNKILFLLNESPPDRNKYLAEAPILVSNFVYPNSMVLRDMGIEQYMGISRKYATSIECTNAPIKFLNIPIFRNIFDVKNILIAYKIINRHIKELQIEYIHCNTPIGGFLGRVCGKRCKVKKVVYTAHGFHFYKGAPLINWLVFYPIERFLARWTDALLIMNEEDFRRAKKFKLHRSGMIYKVPGVGIDLKKIQDASILNDIKDELKIENESVLCISMGDLIKRKNYQIAIIAFKKLPDNVHYLICGKGPELKNLQELAKSLGIQNRIHFLGFRTDIVSLLKQSDIFILSSLQEGLPRSLMEAMACGLPCVVSNIRGNVDLIEHNFNGYLCDPKKADDYANAISMLVKDTNRRDAMGTENSKRILRYDVSSVVQELGEIYKCLQ